MEKDGEGRRRAQGWLEGGAGGAKLEKKEIN